MSRVTLVTGAGRGIGLELCRQLAGAGETVLACPRRAGSADLDALGQRSAGRLHVVPMDVAEPSSIRHARETIDGLVERIDVLFNSAAIYPDEAGGIERLDLRYLEQAFDVNALGPLRVVQGFLALLRRGRDKKLVQLTSLMGSIADNGSGGSYAYRMSKAALNMAVRNLGHELGREGFIAVALHPGWVRTRMGGTGARTPLEDAVRQMLETTASLTRAVNGGFIGRDGGPLPF